MYGLVNKAIEQMVCTHFSTTTWVTIKEHAGVDVDTFLSMSPYPDSTTYALVDSASQILGVSSSTVLRSFGHYWTLYTAAEGYGELLKLTGDSLFMFLQNLDDLHARIGLSYAQLRPPSFQCTEVSEHSLLLHYYSNRAGLTPMVIGLLEGLAERFATQIDILPIASRDTGADHEILQITLRESKK